jgi:hypothetical protein
MPDVAGPRRLRWLGLDRRLCNVAACDDHQELRRSAGELTRQDEGAIGLSVYFRR